MFNTSFEDLEQDSQGCLTTVANTVYGQKFTVRSKYVFGCDGARSPVATKIDLSYNVQPSGGTAYNILFNAELGDMMQHQTGHLHWIMQPDTELEHGIAPVLRMVKVSARSPILFECKSEVGRILRYFKYCACFDIARKSFEWSTAGPDICTALESVDACSLPEAWDGYQRLRIQSTKLASGERLA